MIFVFDIIIIDDFCDVNYFLLTFRKYFN